VHSTPPGAAARYGARVHPPPARPRSVVAAALLLVCCAVLQFALIVESAGLYDGFPPNVWLCSGVVAMPLFAGTAVAVWTGLPAARILVWVAAALSAPWCLGFGTQMTRVPWSAATMLGWTWLVLSGVSLTTATWLTISARPERRISRPRRP
jgi:hypothetical protein